MLSYCMLGKRTETLGDSTSNYPTHTKWDSILMQAKGTVLFSREPNTALGYSEFYIYMLLF